MHAFATVHIQLVWLIGSLVLPCLSITANCPI